MTSAGGIRIGGAFYEITADSAPLIQAMAQAEARSKASAQAIATATGIPEKAVTRYATQAIRSHQQAEKAAQQSAAVQARAALQISSANQQAGASFGVVARGAIGSVAAFAGIAGATALVHAGMQRVAEQTQKAAQAQFALDATYRSSAATYAQFAAQQAEATKRTVSDVQEAIVAFGSLSNRYAFTSEQVKELTKRSADLAAIKGIKTVEAAKRVEAALRGEGEAAEYLGLTLNSDYVKKFADLSAEQRKNWETLDPLIKAQATYREFLKQTDAQLGQAVKRSNEAVGAADRLKTANDNLALTMGKGVNPAVQQATGYWAALIEKLNEYLKKAQEVSRQDPRFAPIGADLTPRPSRPGSIDPESIPEAQAQARRAADAQNAVFDDIRKKREIEAAQRREQIKRDLEAADKANDATAESAIKAIDKERKEKDRWYDEERTRIEARRTYQLEDIEARRDAAIAALEEEKRAAKDALEAQIEDQERLKDARIAAAEEAADRAKAAIDAEKERFDRAREIEDREREDARRREDQNTEGIRRTQDRQIEDARKRQDQAAEDEQESELRRLKKLGDERAERIQDDIERVEAASQRKLRALDREGDRARKNSERALRDIERLADEEDERHRTAIQALEDEQDARLGILDAQLKALDAQEKSADAAERVAGIQKRLSDAQREATAARGTGTPDQIKTARGDLTRALKSGDPIAEANARERLVQLAGKGNEAIREADEKLAEAQADLRKEGVDGARDAERDKLKATQDAIRADIEARKRAAEDENRQRKQSLEREQEAERDKLKSRLDRLEKQKQAAQDDAKEETGRLRDNLDAGRKASQEQIEIARGRFEAAKEVLAQQRVEEDRAREDFRREEDRVRAEERAAQDRFRQDERTEQDKALAVQLAAVNATLEQERKDTEAHFNGPNGTITQLRKAIDASALEYDRRLKKARESYEDERKEAERVYTNPEKTGLLDLLEKARQSEFDKLEKSKEEWKEWARVASEAIKAALADLDAFIKRGANIPRIGSGGGATGSSSGPRPSINGSPVQGPGFDDDNRPIGGGAAATGGNGPLIPDADVERKIRNAFSAVGGYQAQEDAIAVWSREGRSEYVGDHGTSFGPFQLHTPGGLGDAFIRETGLDPRDPSTWEAQISWVAKYVRQNGWNDQWHGAPGYPGTGISIKRYDAGGMIREPVVGRGLLSGQSYAFAERGPEYLIGRRQTASMLGPGPAPTNYAAMGAFMAQAHPGGGGRSTVVNEGDVIFQGLTYAEAEARQKSRQHKARLLRRVP